MILSGAIARHFSRTAVSQPSTAPGSIPRFPAPASTEFLSASLFAALRRTSRRYGLPGPPSPLIDLQTGPIARNSLFRRAGSSVTGSRLKTVNRSSVCPSNGRLRAAFPKQAYIRSERTCIPSGPCASDPAS